MKRYRQNSQRLFYPLVIAAAVATVLLATRIVGIASAIKGSYAIIGLLLAYLFSLIQKDRWSMRKQFSIISGLQWTRLIVVLWLIGISVAILSGNRFYGLILCLPLGYTLIGLQLYSRPSVALVLFQTVLLFSFSPVTKYLMTGFYYATGDTFGHVEYINLLINNGTISSLSRYADFPGFHLLMGTTSFVTGLSAYDTMMVVQIMTYCVLIILLFFLVKTITGDRWYAIITTVAGSHIFYFSYYATELYPQSMATVFVVFLLFTTFRANNPLLHRQFFCLGLLFGTTLVVSHHLTILLFVPVILVTLTVRPALHWISKPEPYDNWPDKPRFLIFLIITVIAFSYWTVQRNFLGEIWYFISQIFAEAVITTEADLTTRTYALGYTVPEIRIETAARSLISPDGIYFILLTTVFTLGVEKFIKNVDEYKSVLGFCIVGILSTPFVLLTPLAVEFTRVRLPLAIFFVFVLGIGYSKLFRERYDSRYIPVVIVLIVVVGSLSPVVAGDDLYNVHPTESLDEHRPLPEPDRELTISEYQQLRTVSEIVQTNEDGASTFDYTQLALAMFNSSYDPWDDSLTFTDENTLTTDRELFVYQSNYPNHRHPLYITDQNVLTVVMSEEWLGKTVATENKVYSAGETGILWNEEHWEYEPNNTASTDSQNNVA